MAMIKAAGDRTKHKWTLAEMNTVIDMRMTGASWGEISREVKVEAFRCEAAWHRWHRTKKLPRPPAPPRPQKATSAPRPPKRPTKQTMPVQQYLSPPVRVTEKERLSQIMSTTLTHSTITAAFFGDPLPGRSALDLRGQIDEESEYRPSGRKRVLSDRPFLARANEPFTQVDVKLVLAARRLAKLSARHPDRSVCAVRADGDAGGEDSSPLFSGRDLAPDQVGISDRETAG